MEMEMGMEMGRKEIKGMNGMNEMKCSMAWHIPSSLKTQDLLGIRQKKTPPMEDWKEGRKGRMYICM